MYSTGVNLTKISGLVTCDGVTPIADINSYAQSDAWNKALYDSDKVLDSSFTIALYSIVKHKENLCSNVPDGLCILTFHSLTG